MSINFYAEGTDLPGIDQKVVGEWIRDVAGGYGKRVGTVSYIFCTDERILEVNRQFLQHDYYTDIITFDYTSGKKISADIYISLDTVRTNSEQFHTVFIEELHRTIIHGILHLCGINDKGPGERKVMEACENKALEELHEMQSGN